MENRVIPPLISGNILYFWKTRGAITSIRVWLRGSTVLLCYHGYSIYSALLKKPFCNLFDKCHNNGTVNHLTIECCLLLFAIKFANASLSIVRWWDIVCIPFLICLTLLQGVQSRLLTFRLSIIHLYRIHIQYDCLQICIISALEFMHHFPCKPRALFNQSQNWWIVHIKFWYISILIQWY